MIALVEEKGRMHEILLTGNHVETILLEKKAAFIFVNGYWHLKLSRDLCYIEKCPIDADCHLLIQDVQTEAKCRIDFYLASNGGYQKYRYPQELSFGQIEPENKEGFSISIDAEKRQIISHGSKIALNGKVICSGRYEMGDVLLGKDLRIIFGPGFLLLRDCQWQHTLEPYSSAIAGKRIAQQAWKEEYCLPVIEPAAQIALKDPVRINMQKGGSSLAMMLPSIMILSSTFLISLLSAYQSYLAGRNLGEILPAVMLPGMMLVSTIVTYPLLAHLQKKKIKKQIQQRNKEYVVYLKKINAVQKQQEMVYHYAIYQNYVLTEKLLDLLAHHIQPAGRSKILVGLWKERRNVSVSLRSDLNDEAEMEEQIQSFQSRLSCKIWQPVFLPSDCRVRIEGEDGISLFLSLVIQAGIYFQNSILICDDDFVQQYPFLLRLPGLSHPQGRQIQPAEMDATVTGEYFVFATLPTMHEGNHILLSSKDDGEDIVIHAGKVNWIMDLKKRQKIFFSPNRFKGHFPPVTFETPVFHTFVQPSFLDLYAVQDTKDLHLNERWQAHINEKSRIAPVGMDEQGKIISIDLSEDKNGPHGLIAGTTGSGKSELILTLCLSLMVNYSPKDLQIAFIDFKGGGASHIFEVLESPMPHFVGNLSNLNGDDQDRVLYALRNECLYRQKLFQEAGTVYHANVMNLADYRILKKKHKELSSLADLVIVVDEFAELKAQCYDMLDQLISIARIGRSLGIHLILSTQKPAGVVNEQIWSNSRFKICLKVAEKQDSMEVLHSQEALTLQRPGEFILSCDGRIKKGICGYSGYRRSLQKIQLEIMAANGSVEEAYASFGEYTEPEILPVCQEIIHAWHGAPSRMLWLNPIACVSEEDLLQHHAVGIIDDYYSQQQPYLTFDFDAKSHWGILAPDMKERRQFLKFMRRLLDRYDPDIPVYVFPDLSFDGDTWQKIKQTTQKKIILVEDSSRYYEKAYQWNTHDLLEHSQEYQIQFIFFLSQSASMPYHDQDLLHHKLCLRSDSLEDMGTFLGTRIKKRCTDMHGLIYTQHLLDVTLGYVYANGN